MLSAGWAGSIHQAKVTIQDLRVYRAKHCWKNSITQTSGHCCVIRSQSWNCWNRCLPPLVYNSMTSLKCIYLCFTSALITIMWALYPRLSNKLNAKNLYFTIMQYYAYTDILFTIHFTVHFIDCTTENSD